jgi:hypothetical protein
MRNSYKIFIGKRGGHRPPEDPGVCSGIIFKLSYKNRVEFAVRIHLAEGGVHLREQGDEHLGSPESRDLLQQLSNYCLPTKESATRT